jgi:hypothetical protein
VEDAGVFLAEALIQWYDLGSHPLVHRHVRHRRQQPAVTQLTLQHKKGKSRATDPDPNLDPDSIRSVDPDPD